MNCAELKALRLKMEDRILKDEDTSRLVCEELVWRLMGVIMHGEHPDFSRKHQNHARWLAQEIESILNDRARRQGEWPPSGGDK